MTLTFFELFAGAGGLSMGLETAGWHCQGHAEIAPFPRKVLAYRWPGVPLFGDVTALTGADIGNVTLLTGGSPCQDLSVAGKRAGMVEGSGTRSSLFFHQVRLWNESGAPYFLWENVLGAFSSNAGQDFAAVLSAVVGAPVPVPDDGWRSAGVASGPAGVAAWRVLDAQYFGVPQRRRRVFVLGARAGGVDPAEVLALSESVSGDSPPSREAGEGTAEATPRCADTVGFAENQRGEVRLSDEDTSLSRGGGKPGQGYTAVIQPIAFHATQTPVSGPVAPSDGATASIGTVQPALFTKQQYGRYEDSPSVDATLGARDHASQNTDVVVYPTIQAGDADKWGSNQWVTEGKAIVDGLPTVAKRLLATGNVKHAADLQDYPVNAGRPRRLTPLECERLMGWPDGWTDIPGASDSTRYMACGNGVASPVAAWIGWQLRKALER